METLNKKRNDIFLPFFSGPMRYLSLSIFSILTALNCYRPVGQNNSPQGCESAAAPKGNENRPQPPSRWAARLEPMAARAAGQSPPEEPLSQRSPATREGGLGGRTSSPERGSRGQRPLVLFPLLSPEKAGPATGSGPPEAAPPTVVAYSRQIPAVEDGAPVRPTALVPTSGPLTQSRGMD